jgi:hypothetical protein
VGWLIGVVATVLALSIAPPLPTCSNDGSHLALALSLSEGRVALGNYAGMAGVDHSQRDGTIYSDRAPGQAFLLVPLIWLGVDPRFLPAAAFGATLAVLYGWLRRDGCSVAVAAATAGLGVTTLLLRYSPVLFAHSLTALLITLAARLVTGPMRHGWVLGLVLGWAGISEYALGALAVVAALIAWRRWPSYYVGLAVAVLPAALYQWVAFGAPWVTSYAYQATFTEARSVGGSFSGPLWKGLQSFVLEGRDSWDFPNYGLLAISPVLALGPLGLFAYGRKFPWQAALLAATCAGYLLLYSKFVAFGAGTMDSRYYVPFLPLLLFGIGQLLARVGWPAWVVVSLLALSGVDNLVAHMIHSYGWNGTLGVHWPMLYWAR